jgi:hypothetical protein
MHHISGFISLTDWALSPLSTKCGRLSAALQVVKKGLMFCCSITCAGCERWTGSCVSWIYGEPAFATFDDSYLQFFIEYNVTPQSSDAAGYIGGLHELLHPARRTVKIKAPPPLHRSASSKNHLKHQVCSDETSRLVLAVFYHLRGLTESQIGFLGFLRPMMSVPTVPLWSALADLLGLKKVRKLWVLRLLSLVHPN